MYEDYYDDSMRLDEMMTAEDYNRFEERELARDRAAEMEQEEARLREVWETYGTEALCEWCADMGHESQGELLATTYDGDVLICPTCDNEWLAIPKDM